MLFAIYPLFFTPPNSPKKNGLFVNPTLTWHDLVNAGVSIQRSRIPPAEALPFRQVGTDVRAQVELEHKPLNASWVRKGMDIYIYVPYII